MTKHFWPFSRNTETQEVRLLSLDELDLRHADIGCAMVFMAQGSISAISHTYPWAAPVIVNDLAAISCFHDVTEEEVARGLSETPAGRWVILHLRLDADFPRMSEIVVTTQDVDFAALNEELCLLLQKGPNHITKWQAVILATVRRYIVGKARTTGAVSAERFVVPAIDADALDWLKEYWRILGYSF